MSWSCRSLRNSTPFVAAMLAATLLVSHAFGQVADGNMVGSVLDPSNAVVPNAKVEALNQATGVKSITQSDAKGDYRFNDLLIGPYTITFSASGFATKAVKEVTVELSKTTTRNVTLAIGTFETKIDVVESGTLIDTTTSQISNIYSTRLAADLPSAANPSGGFLNLSLLGAGVASAGGIGAGTGPSVGGQRPRNNNFTVDGVDNNRKDVTGPVVSLPNDSVAETTILQNQFDAEYGHSSGGQFNTVLRGGTNDIHGTIYEYLQNRNLNSLDQAFAREGIYSNPRYDYNTVGGAIGGPIVKNKLFYYANFDYAPGGFASTSSGVFAPTDGGYAALAAIPGASQTNVNVMKQYVGSAPQGTDSVTVGGVTIPVGIVPILAPSYQDTKRWLGSMDYTMSDKDQWRGRFVSNDRSSLDTGAQLPQFYDPRPTLAKLFSLSEFHTFTPNLANEARLAYNRFNDNIQVTNAQFPGMNVFPNILVDELGIQLGPDPNAPQTVVQNTYQLADNVTWRKGNHNLKFGFDGRDLTSAVNFISRIRGDYEYSTLQQYVLDLTPDAVAQRAVNGSLPYAGNSMAYYLFGQDDWRVSRHLTLSAGLRYELNGVSEGMKEFGLNSLANVPGVLTFFAPQSQKTNFAPRLGFAYSPGDRATTTIRGGFGIAYDQIFDNIGTQVRPPQATTLVNAANNSAPDFLANGGILADSVAPPLTPAAARAATSGWLGNQQLPYAINWTFGIQHVFGKDYVLEVRYLGTRGVHLLLQTELNRADVVTATNYLPTYLAAPSQATLDSLTLTQAALKATSSNTLAAYGFNQSIASIVPQGDSKYNGLATELTKRFSSHSFFKGAYTWSHNLDNSTMELNFTTLSPRRPQDFNNLGPEWASSALDRRQRLTLTWVYALPWFESNHNWFMKNIVGNYQVSGTYTAESPEYVTPLSGVDSNLNSDSAADRVIVNPNGILGTGSGVTSLKNSSGQVVAFLAINPNAQFIQAQVGALANSGRNILPADGINNVDFNIVKKFNIRERSKLELRADFYNGLNHPQYTPGSNNTVLSVSHIGQTSYLMPSNPLFGQWDQVYSSNPRVIQLAAKFTF